MSEGLSTAEETLTDRILTSDKVGGKVDHNSGLTTLSEYPPVFGEELKDSLQSGNALRSLENASKLLGAGGFGSVYLDKFGAHLVAVKHFHAAGKSNPARLESYRAELNVLRLSHPHVVRTLAATGHELTDGSIIVMEYAGERDLQQVINDPLEELYIDRRLRYAFHMASALEYIHSQCIVHLDLKPANVIVGPKDMCKVGDFGCCQVVELDTGRVSPTQRSSLTGTWAYRAPELHRGDPPSTRADLYSLGITLWQMLSREHPFSNQNYQVAIFQVVSCNLRPPLPDCLDRDDPVELCYKDLFCQCWDTDFRTRPLAADVVEALATWIYYL